MTSEDIFELVERGESRKNIKKRIQVSGNLLPLPHLLSQDNKSVQYMTLRIKRSSVLDENYPRSLIEIPDYPVMIFYQGKEIKNNEIVVAVVGSRLMSERGKRAIEKIIPVLVQSGVVIVSGLAIGVDTHVHEVVLDCGGRTIAVLPGPLDYIYPVRNRILAKRIIASNGTLVSEYPLGTAIERKNFLERNRIVAGLSRGVLVIEAGEKSGSIATPNYALDQGREVWCVPAKVGELNSEGVINLIDDGASSITTAEEILATF